jgi:hypothetical protein
MKIWKKITVYRFKDVDEFNDLLVYIKSQGSEKYTVTSHEIYGDGRRAGGLTTGYNWPFYFEVNIGEEPLERIVEEFRKVELQRIRDEKIRSR